MRGYISVEGGSDRQIPLDSGIELYRDADRSHIIVVERGTDEIPLDVSDVTVSRKKNEEAPVKIVPRTDFIEVRNQNNSNGVSVRAEGEGLRESLDEGEVATVQRDSVVELGYQVSLQLVVERERKQVIHHEGEGDVEYVEGDKRVRNVDASTTVNDAVINRSDIAAGSAPEGEDADTPSENVDASTSIEDSVVNRSSVGTAEESSDMSETKKVCDVHDITYRGTECPRCAGESRSVDDTGLDANPEDTPSEANASDPETKYCLHCGDEIPHSAAHCPNCGGRQQ